MNADMPNFTAKAACATAGSPDDWHPDGGWMGNQQALRAKAICQSCLVLEECRAYSIPRPELHGLWGGLSTKERAEARKDGLPAAYRPRARCAHGHLFTPANTTVIGDKRRCRTCHNDRTAEGKRRAKAS